MSIKILKGMKDVLPSQSDRWQNVESIFRKYASLFGFQEIRTPVLEHTELFARGVGDTTDIVQKEMYTFTDKGERSVTLKPEGTAGTVRAFLEAGLYAEALPSKLYYLNSPIFRYESPQSGRLREHHQFGVECFGSNKASSDAEIISLGYQLLKAFEIPNINVQINSIGCSKCRPSYTKALLAYLEDKKDHLCHDCHNRYIKNPLRVLDCKDEGCKTLIKDSPKITDYLCDECKEHMSTLLKYLDTVEIPYIINPYVVRGLDYYTKTVFEFIQKVDNGYLTVCGGGRYDNLVKQLGGPDTPAVGFGMGIERLLMLMEEKESRLSSSPDIFIANITKNDGFLSYKILNELRSNGIKADMDHLGRSLKAQFKFANKSNAKFILMVGGEELERNAFKLRNLETREELEITNIDLINKLKNILLGENNAKL